MIRDPHAPSCNYDRKKEKMESLEKFAKRFLMWDATKTLSRNPIIKVHHAIKKGIMCLVPARYYHQKREERIETHYERDNSLIGKNK